MSKTAIVLVRKNIYAILKERVSNKLIKKNLCYFTDGTVDVRESSRAIMRAICPSYYRSLGWDTINGTIFFFSKGYDPQL